jgi:alkyl hydroperoxide reductase subunit AhpC
LSAQVLGISVDSVPSHKAFAENLQVTFPLLSDMKRQVSAAYGVLLPEQSVAARATFIIDKRGIVRHLVVNDLAFRRNEQEILRILEAMAKEDG